MLAQRVLGALERWSRGVAAVTALALVAACGADGGAQAPVAAPAFAQPVGGLDLAGDPPSQEQPAQASPTAYRLVDIGTLAGMTDMQATAVNRSGQVVGAASVGGSTRAFLWDDVAGLRDLGLLPGAGWSAATAISSAGVVVGNTSQGPFTWRPGVGMAHLLPDSEPGRHAFVASGTNDRGIVVGQWYGYAAMWHPESGATAIPGNSRWDHAYDVNDAGSAVGHIFRGPESRLPVQWDLQGGATVLAPQIPGCELPFHCISGEARATNEAGAVVGTFRVTDLDFEGASPESHYVGRQRAFLWSAAAGMTVLGTFPEGPDTSAVGIDATGHVYGAIGGQAAVWVGDSGVLVGSMVDGSDPLAWIELREAIGADEAGRIVVNAFVSGLGSRVVLLTPAL